MRHLGAGARGPPAAVEHLHPAVVVASDRDRALLDRVIAALDEPEARVRPSLQQSPYWNDAEWKWLTAHAPRLLAVFTAMRDAGFSGFRDARTGDLAARAAQLQRDLAPFDVIRLQQKLTGRSFDPQIDVVLLQFCKPHGIKVQGQTFLQAADWNLAITVRNAAHEMLHPPIPMDGAVAKAALAVLARDPLIPRIVGEHDPKWGYTSFDGYLNEDLVQALDQLISERLGVARNPADRWRHRLVVSPFRGDSTLLLSSGFPALAAVIDPDGRVARTISWQQTSLAQTIAAGTTPHLAKPSSAAMPLIFDESPFTDLDYPAL